MEKIYQRPRTSFALLGEPALILGLLGTICVAVGHVLADGFDGWGEILEAVMPLVIGAITRTFVSPVSQP